MIFRPRVTRVFSPPLTAPFISRPVYTPRLRNEGDVWSISETVVTPDASLFLFSTLVVATVANSSTEYCALFSQAGNHDKSRLVSRYGQHQAQFVTMMTLLLPGVGVTYNGDEIGMEDTWISWENTKDPQGCNAGQDHFETASRDPERTPFQWDDTTSAGRSIQLPKSSFPAFVAPEDGTQFESVVSLVENQSRKHAELIYGPPGETARRYGLDFRRSTEEVRRIIGVSTVSPRE